jgi:Cu/Ag efflux protein CusF
MKSTRILVSIAALLLALCVNASAKDRPHEGKIVSIDPSSQAMVVQGEDGDQWSLYWTETTKLKNGLTFSELKSGDSVHFNFIEKDGKMWVTELRRTHKAG